MKKKSPSHFFSCHTPCVHDPRPPSSRLHCKVRNRRHAGMSAGWERRDIYLAHPGPRPCQSQEQIGAAELAVLLEGSGLWEGPGCQRAK